METIFERIKRLRKNLGLSQEDFAKMVGYTSRGTIIKIEQGEIDISLSKIEKFAKALKTTPEYLMGWEDEQGNKIKDQDSTYFSQRSYSITNTPNPTDQQIEYSHNLIKNKAYRVGDNSFAPRISYGDIVYLDSITVPVPNFSIIAIQAVDNYQNIVQDTIVPRYFNYTDTGIVTYVPNQTIMPYQQNNQTIQPIYYDWHILNNNNFILGSINKVEFNVLVKPFER